MDSVVHIGTGWGEIEISGNQYWEVYKNGTIQSNGIATYNEHGTDAKSYTEIGEIKGDGTSSLEKHYNYIHEKPAIGINYYRIKQVDYDGKFSYSDIASVR